MKKEIFILTAILKILISIHAYSQEYPYEIYQYQEFEKNPTYTLNELTSNNFEYSHKGFLPGTGSYNSDRLSFKHYFDRIFSGAGIFISRNQLNDSVNYSYAGISAAYRNIFFDKAYVKIGITYKLVNNHSSNGIYDNYTFYIKDSLLSNSTFSNFNASFAVTSPSDFYFISAGICDVNPFGKAYSENSPFLKQFYINAGNIINLFHEQKTNYLSVSYIQNSSQNNSFYSRGYFSTFYTTWILNRRSSLKLGLSGGYVENCFYNISPFIYYFRKDFVLFLTNQFQISYKNFQVPYKYLPQISIIIKI